jgi:hypothetical protein
LTPSSFDVSSVDDDVSDNVLAVTTTATATAVTAEATVKMTTAAATAKVAGSDNNQLKASAEEMTVRQ